MAQPAEDNRDAAFRRISEILLRRRGLDLRGYKAPIVTRRVWTRVRNLRLMNLGAYADYLAGHPDETDQLLEAVTINVSEFFRNASLFETLARDVLPALAAARGVRPVRVWSAGCATGEEVWSLALLFRRLAPERSRPAAILGTDIDARALAAAEAGLYPREALRRVPAAERRALFEAEGEELRVGPALRRLCRFERANLLRASPPDGVDLVLCRNLLIFLGEGEQRRVLDVMRRALRPDGLLVLGATERIPPSHARIFRPVDRRHRIYRHEADAPAGEDR